MDQWRCSLNKPEMADAARLLRGCRQEAAEIPLSSGRQDSMMLFNPASGLPPFSRSCGKAGPIRSDDRLFRLSPVPFAACGL